MQPHDAIALESLTHLLIRNLASTSELEASQTKHTQGQHIPKVLSNSQGWPSLLFTTPQSNIVVTSSLGVFRSNRMSQNLLNYDGPHVPVIIIITSDSHTYVPYNLKGLLSSEQDPITGVLQYYNSLFKIPSE
jgi:hypothetical protein